MDCMEEVYLDSVEDLRNCLQSRGLMLFANETYGLSGVDRRRLEGTIRDSKTYKKLPHAWARPVPEAIGPSNDLCVLWIEAGLLDQVAAEAEQQDSEARRLTSLPVEMTFVFLDISDFSKFPAAHQVLEVNSLVRVVNNKDLWDRSLRKNPEAMLCIGDGYIFAFRDPLDGTCFAAYLAQLIESLATQDKLSVDFHFRIGVHSGPVYSFFDPGRKDWNYIGDGINGASRVLAAVGKQQDDVVFISSQVRRAIGKHRHIRFPVIAAKVLDNLTNRGRKLDKHDQPWRVYELNHTALFAKDVWRQLKEAAGHAQRQQSTETA